MLNNKILNKEEKYILAVSGGIDSMVLLDLFYKEKYDFIVCYVDHDKRDNSYLDHLLVKEVCSKLNVGLETIKLSYTAEERKDNFQAIARKKRYDFFSDMALKYNINNIVTAHHSDDLIETILLHLLRGSNLYGYAGIHEIVRKNNLNYLRPLLYVSKEEITEYAKNNQIKYLDDQSNFLDDYKRNRIRHKILPILKEETLNLNLKCKEFNQLLELYFDTTRKNSSKLVIDNKINHKEFLKQDKLIQMDSLNYLFELNNIESSNTKINSILELLNKNKNFSYSVGNNSLFIKEYDDIFIRKVKEKPVISTYTFDTFSKIDYNCNNKKIYFVENIINNNRNYLKICYNKFTSLLEIRTRKPSDYIKYSYGKKTIKKLFIDLKIPKDKREEILLLVINENEVIWIPELKIRNFSCENEDGYLIYEEVI